MTLAFWYWLLLVVFVFWYGGTDYRVRATYGRWWWGRSLVLVILLIIIGFKLFKDPLGTLVTG